MPRITWLLVFVFILSCKGWSFDQLKEKGDNELLVVCNNWLMKSLELTKTTTGYTPPVAARTLARLSLGMLVVAVNEDEPSKVLSKLGISLSKLSYDDFYLSHRMDITNEFLFLLVEHYYENMSPNSMLDVERVRAENRNLIPISISEKESRKVIKYATKLSVEFIEKLDNDGAYNCWNTNFPEYPIEKCDSCWIPTYPGFVGAMQPYWGDNKLMLSSSSSLCDSIACLKFSDQKNSLLYNESEKMVMLYDTINTTQKNIAEHWDDSPGVSGTPAGHMFRLAMKLSKEQHFDLQRSLQLYVALGTALNDAVIECWRLKYKYNFIRPVTYIHNHITEDFKPILVTPPFPEFPSGHSFQAGASLEVFLSFFEDSTAIIDDTNVNRKDIDGSVHEYNSFSEMCYEMSQSRYFGGIHYMKTLEISVQYGRKFGQNTVRELFKSD